MRRRAITISLAFLIICFAFSLAAPFAAAQGGPDLGRMDDYTGDMDDAAQRLVQSTMLVLVLLHYVVLLILFWIYVSSNDWMNRDGEALGASKRELFNMVFFFMFGIGMVLGMIPLFGLIPAFFCYLIPFASYVHYRNGLVSHDDEKVFSKQHLRKWFGRKLRKVGIKVSGEDSDPLESGLPISLAAIGGSHQELESRKILSRQSPGFNDVRQILCDALFRNADGIMLDFTAESVNVRHQIDGVWHPDHGWERERGDSALASIKILSGLNPEDRRNRQENYFAAKFEDKTKYRVKLSTQGTQTGERALVEFQNLKTEFSEMVDLGLPPPQIKAILDNVNREKGFVFFVAPPKNGLKTTMNVVLRAADRFTREFAALENKQSPYEEIENIPVEYYDPAAGQKLTDIMEDFFLKEPQAVVCRDIQDGAALKVICDEVEEGERMVISTMRARDSVEALIRILSLGIPPAELAQRLTCVISQRLVRKLCMECREAYQPDPRMLQQLGLPADRVKALYRPHKPIAEEGEKPCVACDGIGYSGRTAIVEIMLVDDNIRKALATNPTPDALRQAARLARVRTIQQEGVIAAARGVTTVEEVMRVLKQG
jgi:general secretion pathway protein E